MCSLKSNPSLLSRTFLVGYSKTKLNASDDKASPCFRSFRTRIAPDTLLRMLNLFYILSIRFQLAKLVSEVYRIHWKCTSLPPWLSDRPSRNLLITDVFSHCKPVLFQYLTIADYLISCWLSTSKSTLMISSNFFLRMLLTLKEK
jgi:hypothetical protein